MLRAVAMSELGLLYMTPRINVELAVEQSARIHIVQLRSLSPWVARSPSRVAGAKMPVWLLHVDTRCGLGLMDQVSQTPTKSASRSSSGSFRFLRPAQFQKVAVTRGGTSFLGWRGWI